MIFRRDSEGIRLLKMIRSYFFGLKTLVVLLPSYIKFSLKDPDISETVGQSMKLVGARLRATSSLNFFLSRYVRGT